MNVACTSESCPIVLNSKCVFYEGAALSNIAVSTNDSIQTVIQKINTAFDDIINNFSAVWGNIGGTVEDQVDLITYLDANYAPISAGGYWPLTGTAPSTGAVVINGAHKKTISVNSTLALYGGLEATDGGGAIWGGSGATDYATAVRGIQVTSTGINVKGAPINYATDLSASFTARSLVDKAYVDAAIVDAGWATSGVTTLTTDVLVEGATGSEVITFGADLIQGFTGIAGFNVYTGAGGLFSTSNDSFQLTSQYASLISSNVLLTIVDNRATKAGLEYDADYSADFTDRSLADWGNVLRNGATTTLSGDTYINLGSNILNIYPQVNGGSIGIGGDVNEFDGGFAAAVAISAAGVGIIGTTSVTLQQNTIAGFTISSSGFIVSDFRGTKKGVEYAADYSAAFTSRSLIDKGFSDTAYWKTTGDTLLTGTSFIRSGTGGPYGVTFGNGTDTGLGSFTVWTGSDYTLSLRAINLGYLMFSGFTGEVYFQDFRATPLGIEYFADYSATFTARSLVDKAYVDSLIGTGNFWPLDNNASLLTDVTLTQDGFEVRFAGTNANTDVFLDPLNSIRIRVGIDDIGFQYTGLTTEGVVSQKTGTGQLFSFTGDGLNWSSGVANIEFTQQAAGYFTFNNKAYFTSENSSAPINIGAYVGDVIGSTDGDIWYNSTLGRFRIQQGSTIKNMVDPFAIVEDVPGTTYTFTEADHGKIKRFTHASGCLATVPIGLSLGWTTTAYRASGAGLLTFASDGVLESAGTTLDSEKTAATLFNRGTNIHVAVGAFGTGGGGGGITNSAGANELMKSDGTNAVSSGVTMASTATTLDMQFNIETTSGNNEIGVTLQAVVTDTTLGNEDFDLVVKLMSAGAAVAEKFRFSSTGALGVGGNYGTSGQVLTSSGPGSSPTWETPGSGGITNTAANNELMKSNGFDAIPSGLFSTTDGSILLGAATGSGSVRTVTVQGSSANIGLSFTSKGTGSIQLNSESGGVSLVSKTFDLISGETVFSAAVYAGSGMLSTVPLFSISNSTTGTPATGIGSGIAFRAKTSAANNFETGATIETISTDLTGGSEDFDLVLKTMAAGTLAERVRVSSIGNIGLGIAPNASYKMLIKGVGNTDFTQALRVENSDGNRSFTVSDVGNIVTGSVGYLAGPQGVFAIGNAVVVPGAVTISNGGFLYVEAGALKYKGSSATVTTIAPA